MLAGVSSPCRVAADCSRACNEAAQTLRCLTNLRQGRDAALSLLAADDLGARRLLLNMVDATDADRFTRNAPGPLLQGDSASELLYTLRAFFDSGRSVCTAAKRLGVHENTIRNRLARILDLTGLDVAGDADAQLSAQVALAILHIQGRLPTLSDEADSSHDSTGTTKAVLPPN